MKTLTVGIIATFTLILIIGLMTINAGDEIGFFFVPVGFFGLIVTALSFNTKKVTK